MSLSFQEIIYPLGLTLLDSLWQGASILLACGGLLWLLRHKASRVRYYVVLSGLLALPILAMITFSVHYQPTPDYEAVSGDAVMQVLSTELSVMDAPFAQSGLMDQWYQWAETNAGYICFFWIIGLVLFAIRLSGGFYMVHSLKRNAHLVVDAHWAEKLEQLSTNLKVKARVSLMESAKVTSPIALGYLKPVIIFPMGLISGLPTEQIEAILLHELAHIKRYDYMVNVLVSSLQMLFFYHPAYWWLYSQLDTEREYSCDDLVLKQTGDSLSLIKALTAVREFQLIGYTPSMAFAGQKNQLLKRVERIMSKKTRTNWLGGLVSISALLLSFFLMTSQAQQSQNGTKSENAGVDSLRVIRQSLQSLYSFEDSLQVSTQRFEVVKNQRGEDSLRVVSWDFKLPQLDTLTIEKATMNLINREKSGISLFTDDEGNIVSIKKNGKKIKGKDLEVYTVAYKRLIDYVKKQEHIRQNIKELEQEAAEFNKRLREVEFSKRAEDERQNVIYLKEKTKEFFELYKNQVNTLRDQLATLPQNEGEPSEDLKKEIVALRRVLVTYQRSIIEIKKALGEIEATDSDLPHKAELRWMEYAQLIEARLAQLEAYQQKLKAWEQKSQFRSEAERRRKLQAELVKLNRAYQSSSESRLRKELIAKLRSLEKKLAETTLADNDYEDTIALIEQLQQLTSTLKGSESQRIKNQLQQLLIITKLKKQKELLKLSLQEQQQALNNRQTAERLRQQRSVELDKSRVKNGSYEYTENQIAQDHLVSTISDVSAIAKKPLIVVDGQVKKDWSYMDLNQLKSNRLIKTLKVQAPQKVTDPAYTKLMKDRDVLVLIQTASGSKKFKRPKLYQGEKRVLSANEVFERNEEVFTKKMVEQLQSEGLMATDWSSLSLSPDAFMIDGKEQSRKSQKKYLKLYKEIVGRSLPKGTSVWLNN